MNPIKDNKGVIHMQYWDNAHNLYVQLAFEWGFLALLLLGGYIRQLVLWFNNAIKDRNTVALMGFVLVFFIVNIAQFPLFLARVACFCIPLLALTEIQIRD